MNPDPTKPYESPRLVALAKRYLAKDPTLSFTELAEAEHLLRELSLEDRAEQASPDIYGPVPSSTPWGGSYANSYTSGAPTTDPETYKIRTLAEEVKEEQEANLILRRENEQLRRKLRAAQYEIEGGSPTPDPIEPISVEEMFKNARKPAEQDPPAPASGLRGLAQELVQGLVEKP